MKKSPQSNQENERKQANEQGFDLEKDVAETIMPQRRSVQSMQAINLEDTPGSRESGGQCIGHHTSDSD